MTSAPPTQAAERRRGYGRWGGKTTAHGWRWWVIARGNLQLALASRWVKGLLLASFIPGIILAGITYFFLPLSAPALEGVMRGSAAFAFLVTAVVGARLVADDRRQGAFLAHFSRPVTRLDYVAGKFVALAIPLLVVTMGSPAFAIAADASVDEADFRERVTELGEFVPGSAPEASYLREASYGAAWGAVLWFGLVVSLSTAGIALGISALTTRARYAGVIWFALVAFGAAAHGILSDALEVDWPATLSWFDGTSDVAAFLLGLEDSYDRTLEYDLATRVSILTAAAVAGLAIVYVQLRRAEAGVR